MLMDINSYRHQIYAPQQNNKWVQHTKRIETR